MNGQFVSSMDQELTHWLEFGWRIDDQINESDDFIAREKQDKLCAEHWRTEE